MTEYNDEQLYTLKMVSATISAMDSMERERLKTKAKNYLSFREEVAAFSCAHLAAICKEKCYNTGISACCTREGIITYFADVVINVLYSTQDQLDLLEEALVTPSETTQCVYLSPAGCLWTIKPIVCEMFFCDGLITEARTLAPSIKERIEDFKARQKEYTWPDKPVIFDRIESIFIEKGLRSSLMYFHASPGLMRIKKQAGIG